MLHNRRSSTVVQSTLLELLNRNKQDAGAEEKTVYVILFYHMNGIQDYVEQIKALHDKGIRIKICPDDEVLNHFRVTELARQIGVDDFLTLQQLEKERNRIHHLYIPVLPFSTVSDILHFNDMRTSIRIILWTLMKGRKVTALSAGADPHNDSWYSSGLDKGTPYLKRQMKQQLQQIKGFGIRLIDKTGELVDHFITTNKNEQTRVITEKVIKKLMKAEKRIVTIDKSTIITPLARDLAREYQITFDEDRGG